MVEINVRLVDAAERSLRAFGGKRLTRERAEQLLRSWGHTSSLTEADRAAVLGRFGTPADVPASRGGSR